MANLDEGLISFRGLQEEFGWTYCYPWTREMEQQGRFPPSLKPFGNDRCHRRFWKRADIVNYFANLKSPTTT